MATAQLPYSPARTFSAAETQRRRETRRPAGWLGVEAEIVGTGRRAQGRLLDTSSGGLGLVLNERLPLGTAIRITPTDPTVGGSHWQGREARVVYSAELPGGSWRMGLAFTFARPSSLQMWGTRAVLLSAMLASVASVPATQGESMLASSLVGVIVAVLFAGSEWQHRSEVTAYQRAVASQKNATA
ncbi:MAG TPA: PilZ domain-containing protein [Chloroflexota bacterium]|nr:PilZ domain-containing protein [Chloroflexota bacterium]